MSVISNPPNGQGANIIKWLTDAVQQLNKRLSGMSSSMGTGGVVASGLSNALVPSGTTSSITVSYPGITTASIVMISAKDDTHAILGNWSPLSVSLGTDAFTITSAQNATGTPDTRQVYWSILNL